MLLTPMPDQTWEQEAKPEANAEASHMRRARAGPERSEDTPVSKNNASTKQDQTLEQEAKPEAIAEAR